jgi:hypothetical protein
VLQGEIGFSKPFAADEDEVVKRTKYPHYYHGPYDKFFQALIHVL